jgi:hypothetical protein
MYVGGALDGQGRRLFIGHHMCASARTVSATSASVAAPARHLKWRAVCLSSTRMSQKTVQFVIGWLLTDEDLRRRFVERPRETLDEVRRQGYELTMDELDALARSDPAAWPSMARRIHPRLQRCPLR